MRRRGREPSTPLATLLAARDAAARGQEARTFLVFEAGGTLYAVDVSSVEIVVGSRFVAPVPTGPPELLGVASVHGRMRLVVDLARPVPRSDGAKWWLVVLHGDGQLALVADRVVGLEPADPDGRVISDAREARVLDPDELLEI
jgi:chemotaxis signal transduction protein